ncbi:hypothetical protein [Aphanizomenon flos-aquae]|uniref:hypothetical protein n=1 Tax=Aphanizomenon flos-aquae TaxID=1176 RepID=UPI000488CA81|nr:hypothetical protein [Aphanizomenon flos-aquae]
MTTDAEYQARITTYNWDDLIKLCVFSRTGFTEATVTLTGFVAPQTILLWGGEEIEYSLEKKCICEFLVKKYRVCVQKCIPNYDVTTESFS